MRRVVISPHLDDAVLSAWSAVSEPGAEVTVVTAFAGLPDAGRPSGDWEVACGVADPRGLAVLRRAEDAAALATCGAGWVHLDYVDAQHRPPGPVHRALVTDLAERCQDADEVWVPAAIGGHPDHLATARAGLEAAAGRRVVLYADQPYAAWWCPPPRPTGPEDGRRAARLWLNTLVGASPHVPAEPPHEQRLDAPGRARKQAALVCYITQLRGLATTFPGFGAAEPPTPEWWWLLPEDGSDRRPLWALPDTHASTAGAAGAEVGPRLDGGAAPAGPFLSVLTRTRGDRPDALAEALSSLAAQRSRHFEVILLVHDGGPAARASVLQTLAGAPAWLRQVTRVEQVQGGTVARPLNVGLWVAAGSYVACLDDDDVAFPDWVGEFERLAVSHPGQVLRTRVIRRFSHPGHGDGEAFPEEFDLLEHLSDNGSPVCGLAFPREALATLGLRFDEDLVVAEDWDLLLRAGSLLGVAGSPTVTSAYCMRGRGDDPLSRHGDAEFSLATRHIVHKADRRPLLLPRGSVSALRARHDELLEARREAGALRVELGGAKEHLAQLEEELHAALDQLAAEREARASTLARVEAVSTEVERQQAAAKELAAALGGALRRADEAEAIAEDYRRSTSWRVTGPFRVAGRIARWALRSRRSPRRP